MIRALLAVLLAPAALPAASPRDLVADLSAWVEEFAARGGPLDETDLEELEPLLIDLRGYARTSTAHRRAAARVLLDLYGTSLAASRGSSSLRAADGWALQERAGAEFAELLQEDLTRWVTQEVLVVDSGNPPARRAAAAHLLAGERTEEVRLGLLVCARGSDPDLASAAAEALVGWPDESVHQLFLQTLWRADAETPPALLGAAEAHFRARRLEPGSRLVAPLESYVRERITAESWRLASRAVAVSAGLPNESAVPLLIDALRTWIERSQDGRPVRRIQHDLARELRARSGLDLGVHPDRWGTWWNAVRSGSAEPRPRDADAPSTRADFFGLRPQTDRVVFVIDRSGSMDRPFRPPPDVTAAGWTRYREAVRQMVRFLEALGPDARFNVVLFHDGAESWRRELRPATTAHLRAARGWALRRSPGGGTQLRHGVEEAMRVRPDGSLDLDDLEADTLIVLCDGKTGDGERWVIPFLRRVNPVARIVIHGVQIGQDGDDALALLAQGTGGDFARVADE